MKTEEKCPVLDEAGLRDRTCDDEELLREVIDLFVQETPTHEQEVRSALQTGDMDLLGRAMHAIKGTAGNMGGARVLDLSGKIEESTKHAPVTALSDDVEECLRQLHLLKQALVALVRRTPVATAA